MLPPASCVAVRPVSRRPRSTEGSGAVGHFDAGGRPYYFNNGTAFWVPVQSPYYAGYLSHWRTYGGAYHRWYAGYGHRYRPLGRPDRYKNRA